MKTFIAQQMEIAECELVAEGLPATQQGAEELAARRWNQASGGAKSRQLKGLFGKTYRKNRQSQIC